MKLLSIRKTNAVKKFIKRQWTNLTRTHKNICDAAIDSKIKLQKNEKWPVYIPRGEKLTDVECKCENLMCEEDFEKLAFKHLPTDYRRIKKHGLLYLPHPYVVPGGRFNEMYGWDSHFIILGLLEDGLIQPAIWMAENLIYEIEHYGKVLNANRTYYLQRSQPPLISESVLAIYNVTEDKDWLKMALPAIIKTHKLWMTHPRFEKSTGLSRFYAESHDKPPEVSVRYYRWIKKYFRTNLIKAYDIKRFYDEQTNSLTPEFYHADRTMRESGFDLTNKYGPFGADIASYIPVSLNSLLYKIEKAVAKIYQLLGDNKASIEWMKLSKNRADLINYYLWEPDLGYYFDFNYVTKISRPYVYATTFYPLWAKIASRYQAERIVANMPALTEPGGILCSTYVTGMQWDAPFGWAPHQLIAVQGLHNYGYIKEAKEIAANFANMINDDFARTNMIYEKYNLRKQTSNVENDIEWGYKENVEGFGWTNGVYLVLLDYLASH